MSMIFERKLTIPKETKEMFPLTEQSKETVKKRNSELCDIFDGLDKRLILIVGPCSADNPDAVCDYISKLHAISDNVKDKIFIIPRVYTTKPRTSAYGYKGILHQPDPTEKPDMFKGIVAQREMHIRVLNETGFTCADEMLYPEDYRYLDDILCYVSVGARSVENQQHRLTASGIEIPVGMKNPTSGDISVMLNAVKAAQSGHTFLYRGWEVHSDGNRYVHSILRGSVDKSGKHVPNYHYEDLISLYDKYNDSDLQNPSAIIDANHSNSGKNPYEQGRIINEVLTNMNYSKDINSLVKGFMIESYIEDGSQKIGEGIYGKSITDACLGIEKTERLIYDIAERI